MNRLKLVLRPLVPDFVMNARLERRFFAEGSWYQKHLGVFTSFATANAYISQRAEPTGFILNHDKWLNRYTTLRAHDYPVVFWLSRLLPTSGHRTVVDFGGSVGASYYLFRKFIDMPDDLSWTVIELDAAVELGRKIAAERKERALRFTLDSDAIQGADIFLAAGAAHYLEEPLGDILKRNAPLPRHLIINKFPLSPEKSFVTIESGGNGLYPCRIQSESSFIAEMDALGYRLKDSWKCLEHKMEIIGKPQFSLSFYRGLLFSLE